MGATETKSPNKTALVETLCTRFTAFRDGQPLALGIHKAIKERIPEVNVAQLRMALKTHTASMRYLKAMSAGKERFDLDGNPAGEITDEHRELANTTLRERFRRAAERRKATEMAQQEAQRERDAQQKRQEQLAQLTARFNAR